MAVSKLEAKIKSLEKAMESEIETIEKEIEKYQEYKEHIQDVSEAYENAENVRYALAVTGFNSESEILQCRMDTLNNFKNNYVALQQQIANAAWNSANEQIKAAQEAQKAASGSLGSASSVGDTSSTAPTIATPTPSVKEDKKVEQKQSTERYQVVDADTGEVLVRYQGSNAESKARAYANRVDDAIHPNVKVKKYHTGLDEGYVGNSTNKDDRLEILRKAGSGLLSDEVPTILKRDELVLTTDQQQNIVSNLLRANPNMFMPNVNVPQLDFSMLRHNDSMQTNVNIGEIHMHEVQNVADFGKELQKHLPTLSVQFRGKH